MQLRTLQAWLSSGLILVFSGQHHHLFHMESSSLVLRRLGPASPGVSHEVLYYLTQSVPGRGGGGGGGGTSL